MIDKIILLLLIFLLLPIHTDSASKLSDEDIYFLQTLKKMDIIDKDPSAVSINTEGLIRLRQYLKKEDRRFFTQLNDMGLLSKERNSEMINLTNEQWEYFKKYMEEGIFPLRLLGDLPDSRFASPEKTWNSYKTALINGDFDLALNCFVPSRAKKQKKVIEAIGKEKMREIARQWELNNKVEENKEKAMYQITSTEEHDGKTASYIFDIQFINIVGNWKIIDF
ncbi:MAG: hypothetical protein HY809_06520 [Nitrospirae bacterium]|nr:hypothetical protein [Nitrospirota bacterium]